MLAPLILALLGLQQATPDSTPWPPEGVLRPGQGVSAPVLLHETKPFYTAEAMRARIQGVVVLECIIKEDGSVSDVRVTRSLDATFGLDQEAIKALKRWRFQPGRKDGVPVPVMVMVEMSYTLRERPDAITTRESPPAVAVPFVADEPVPLAWPDGFDASVPTRATNPGAAAVTKLTNDVLHQPGIDITFAYSSDWSAVRSSVGVTLYSEDGNGMRAVSISSPQPAQFSLTQPLTRSTLDSFTLAAQAGAAFVTSPRLIKSGQVLRDDGLWIWFEMAAPSFAAWNAPSALADRLRNGYGGIHVWSFATTAAGQSVSVFCTVVHRAGLSDSDQRAQLQRAGSEFGDR